MSDRFAQLKARIAQLRAAQYDFDATAVKAALVAICDDGAIFHHCHPIGDVIGPEAFYDAAYAPLLVAMPDLERRDWIVIAGETEHGGTWVGCAGHYVGTFVAPWLDIPPTGHLAHMRFHEFYRFKDGKVVEFQAIWDIPELMMQASAWPLAPSLGREMMIPGPASQDGLSSMPRDADQSARSCQHIVDMLNDMKRHPKEGGPDVMRMDHWWHPRMNWYGPAGIGTGRGIAGFRNWHQIPFLAGMPDRGQYLDEITYHFFAQNDYCAVTGWPNMVQTITDGGWMGIAPSNKRIEMRSLDFWRLENGLIRENWVLVDLIDMYRQIGVDVFERLREFNKARVVGAVPFPVGAP